MTIERLIRIILKRTIKIGIVTFTIFMLSLSAYALAASPKDMMGQISTELESAQNTILARITELSNQLFTTESTLSSQQETIVDKSNTAIEKIDQVKADTSQALADIASAQSEVVNLGVKLEALSIEVDALQSSIGSIDSQLSGFIAQSSQEHAEILAAINGIPAESRSVEYTTLWTSATQTKVTDSQSFHYEPKSVTLWIYTNTGLGGPGWEHQNGSGYDAFGWIVKINGRVYASGDGNDPYEMLTGGLSAHLLVDDIMIAGTIEVSLTQTSDRPNPDGTAYNDPVNFQWIIG